MISQWGAKEAIIASTALVKLLRLQQITGGFANTDQGNLINVGTSKLQALEEIIDNLEDQKVVVWARFKEEIKRIQCSLLGRKRPFLRLTGDETTKERFESIEKFQKEDKPYVMIGNVASGGVGVDLYSSSHCIYFSNTWSLGDRMQSEDRLHRIGQKNPVTYYDLIAKETIDEYIYNILKNKEKLSDKITGDDLRKIAYNK